MTTAANAEPLSYAGCLPLAWKPLAQPLAAAEILALAAGNQQTLTAVAAVEGHGAVVEEDAPLDREIARLHRKMDVLLEIVSGLLRVQAPQPPAVPMQLSSQDLVWHGEVAPREAGHGIVEIYLHRSVLEPLRLPAVAEPRGREGTRLVFLPLDEPSAAALETHVFLRHRRSIAEARLSQKR